MTDDPFAFLDKPIPQSQSIEHGQTVRFINYAKADLVKRKIIAAMAEIGTEKVLEEYMISEQKIIDALGYFDSQIAQEIYDEYRAFMGYLAHSRG